MKKHIVILVGSYYPNYSAVGICAKNVVNELKKEVHVSVIAQKTTYSDDGHVFFEGYDLYRISDQLHSIYLKYPNSILSYAVRCIRYVRSLLQKVNIGWSWVKSYHEKLEELAQNREIDTIVCFSFPFESIVAGVKYKQRSNPNVKVIPYIFDNFSMNISLHRTSWNRKMKMNNHIQLVEKILCETDLVIAIHTFKNHYDQYYSHLSNIIKFVEHPLLVPLSNCKINSPLSIQLVYTGSFLRNYVEPFELIKLLEILIGRINKIKIDIYAMGHYFDILVRISKKYPDNITFHGRVPFDNAQNAIAKSSIMLCVAEKSGIQLSSKIFTIMSYGKPILLLYSVDNDINKQILDKYPLFKGIKTRQVLSEEEINNIELFIYNNYNELVEFNEVKEIYPEALPAYSAQLILNS
jgi:hypothetical protein